MNKQSSREPRHTPHPPKSQGRVVITMGGDEAAPGAGSVTEEMIRRCAYERWEAAGRPAGNGVQFWLDAERQLSPPK